MKIILAALLLLWSSIAVPQVSPMASYACFRTNIECGNDDYVMLNLPAHGHLCGSGIMPTQEYFIVGISLIHKVFQGGTSADTGNVISDPIAYIMVGQTQPNGDYLTPLVEGSATATNGGPDNGPGRWTKFYEAGRGFLKPTNSELHVHTRCSIGNMASPNKHELRLVVWYMLP